MRKTSLYLSDDDAEQLRRAAATTGRSQADLIREGIHRLLAELAGRPRVFHSLGKGRGDGRPDVRWNAEDLYRKAMGER